MKLRSILPAFLAVFALSSCDSTGTGTDTSYGIVGTWSLLADDSYGTQEDTYVFKNNGSYTFDETPWSSTRTYDYSESGTWYISGNALHLYPSYCYESYGSGWTTTDCVSSLTYTYDVGSYYLDLTGSSGTETWSRN
jgi:hypothetical protein